MAMRKDLACAKSLRTPAEAVVVPLTTRKLYFMVMQKSLTFRQAV